jgi:hypothetical protein
MILGLQKITKRNKIFINQNRLTRPVFPHITDTEGPFFYVWIESDVYFLGTDLPFEVLFL